MKSTRIAASLALGLALLSPLAGARQVDTEWWNVDFESPTPNGVTLAIGELGALTNQYSESPRIDPPYLSGFWTAIEGDESCVTNGVVTNFVDGAMTEVALGAYLKLDTQGNDLTWTPTNVATKAIALVDADIQFVGSDSAPDATDFDSNAQEPVQTAIYLKNEIDEGTGETTNSVLCVYAYDDSTGGYVWHELGGVQIGDNSWHHVQVLVDYTENNDQPLVKVYVDGTQMTARGDASTKDWTVAHPDTVKTTGRVQSVSFRGTGSVDNFAGQTRVESFDTLTFSAEVYMNGVLQPSGATGNLTRYVDAEAGDAGSGKKVTFEGFRYHDFDQEITDPETGYPLPPTYNLRKIEFVDFVSGSTVTLNYGMDARYQAVPETETNAVSFVTETVDVEDPDTGEIVSMDMMTGPFSVSAVTDGATDPTNTVIKIYLKTIGAFDVYGETYVDSRLVDTETYSYVATEVQEGATREFSFPYSKTVNGSNYVLRSLVPATGLVPVPGASAATVTATVYGLSADYLAAQAYYVPGDYTGKAIVMNDPAEGESAYSFLGAVAQIVAVDGENVVTNYYETLQAALGAVPADGTETTVELLADVSLAQNVAVSAGKNVFLDLGGHEIESSAHAIANWGTLSLTNGTITAAHAAVYNAGEDASVTIWDGEYTSTAWNAIANYADGASVTIHGGIFQAQEFCVAIRAADTTTVIDGGTFTSIDNAVVGTNGTDGMGGNSITITGGTLNGGIVTAGYIACGVYLANDDTLLFGGDATMNITGGAGIVARAGAAQVGVEGGTIVTTGTTTGKVGDANVQLPCAAIVYDTSAGYPGLGQSASLTVTGGTFISTVDPIVQIKAEGDATVLAVSGGSFSDVVPEEYCAEGYVPVTTPVNGLYTVGLGAVKIEIDGTVRTFGAIRDAQYAAEQASIADPVFEIFGVLSPETNTLASVADVLKIKVTGDGDATALEVVTVVANGTVSESGPDADGVITYSVVVQTFYEITFELANGENDFVTNVLAGAENYGPAEDPTKASDVQFDYTFAGWTNATLGGATVATEDLPAAAGATTYTATYSATTREYWISWDVDGTVTSNKVAYGETPTHAEPAKASSDTTVYTFAGWTPEIVAVAGEATYTATWTETVRTYAIVFYTNEVVYATTNATWNQTGYGPADPEAEGYDFVGWTNAVAGGAVVATADLPAVTGEAEWTAVFEEEEEVRVNPGDGLAAYKTAHPEATVPEPIAFNETTEKCEIAFVAPAAGYYALAVSDSLATDPETWTVGSAWTQATDTTTPLVITESSTATVKFFVIVYSKTDPAGE